MVKRIIQRLKSLRVKNLLIKVRRKNTNILINSVIQQYAGVKLIT